MNSSKFSQLFKHSFPSQNPFELYSLLCWLNEYQGMIKGIIEVGTLRGGTLRFWIEMLDINGWLISIDNMSEEGSIPLLIDEFANDKRIKFIIGDSTDKNIIVSILDIIGEQSPDIVFIDGSHETRDLQSDICNYGSMLRPGGILICHDIINPNIRPTWKRLVGEHKMGMEFGPHRCNKVIEFYGEIPCGIGVMII